MNTSVTRFGTRLAVVASLVAVMLVTMGATAWAQTLDDYRSGATGNWNAIATWQRYDGTAWVAATVTPTSANGVITIRTGHVVTIPTAMTLTYDQVVVDAGGQVTVSGTAVTTMANGTGTDLTINGTWLNSLTTGSWTATGATWTVGAGGTYIHNTTTGISTPLGLATLNAASNFIYRGSSTLTPAISMSGRTYGNLSFESTSGSWTAASGVTTGTFTINGGFTIGSGVTYSTAQTGVMTFAGDFTNNGTLTNGAGTQVYTFTGAGKTVSGTGAIAFETLNVNGGASLTLASPVTIGSGFIGTVTGTLATGATLTNTGTLAVNGTLKLNPSGSVSAAPTYGASSILVYARSKPNTDPEWGSTGAPPNVTIQAGPVTLGGNRTVSGTLTFSSGNILTGANTLTIGSSGSIVTPGSGTGWVNGNLQLPVPSGTPTVTFPLGDASTNYTPVALAFTSVTTTGSVTASTTVGMEPNFGSSTISTSKYVNRYWTFATSDVVGAYGATFNFVPGDKLGSADWNKLVVGRYDTGGTLTWSYPTVGSRTATSTQATGLTSFSDFVLGEPTWTITASAGLHGSISPSGPVAVLQGADQTFDITPDLNYAVANVLVDGSSVGAVTSYTFPAVAATHTISASFKVAGTATVALGAVPGWITLTNGDVVLPVEISRSTSLPNAAAAFSVTFTVAGNILLPDGKNSIGVGPYLGTDGGRTVIFQTIDKTGGVYQADGTTQGAPCGTNATSGTLFYIHLGSTAPGGSGTVTLNSVKVRDCSAVDITSSIGGTAATIYVDRLAPTVALSAPNGGEIWAVGSSHDIIWTGDAVSYDLAYSTDGGGTYPNVIATGLTGSPYPWTVPGPASATVRVRVTGHDDHENTASAASNANFAITSITSHTITVTRTGNGAIDPAGPSVTVADGADQTFTFAPDPNHHVSALVVDLVAQTLPPPPEGYKFSSVTADHTIDVTFAIDQFTLTYAAGTGGSIVGPHPQTVDYNTNGALVTATPDLGYHFAGWSDAYPTAARTDLNVTANKSVTATFAIDTFTLTYAAGAGGSIVGPHPQTVDYNTNGALVTATPDFGYHFVSWSDAYPTAARTDLNVTANKSVTATFAIDQFKITASAGPGGTIFPSGDIMVNRGADQSFTITAPDGYAVSQVLVDDAPQGPIATYTFTNVQAGHTIAASFVSAGTINVGPPAPELIVASTDHVTVPFTITRGSSTPKLMGFSVVFKVSTPLRLPLGKNSIHQGTFLPTGYSFYVWDKGPVAGGHLYQADGSTMGSPCGTDALSGLLFTVDLDATQSGTGTVSIDSLRLRNCDNGSITPTIGTSSTVPADLSVTLTVLASPEVGGTVTQNPEPAPETGKYQKGAAVTLTAVPTLPGWHLVGWDGGLGTVSPVLLTLTGDQTVTATFALDIHTLTTAVTPEGSGTIARSLAGPNYEYGTVVTLTANPAAGHHFVGWDGGLGTVSPVLVTVTGNKSVTATFEDNPAVGAISDLVATQILTGTPAGSTTKIKLTWTGILGGTTVEVWRKGFGSYPEYDDAAGAVPTASATYPPGTGWTLTEVTEPNGEDLVAVDRDFYYFVAFVKDDFGTWSPASNLTTGTLNYFLGDVTGAGGLGVGDNRVETLDISALGGAYGYSGAQVTAVSYLDVGPTSTGWLDGLPSTDNEIEFEDLVLFALNFGLVSAPQMSTQPVAGTVLGPDALMLERSELVALGEPVTVTLRMKGSGTLRALSTKLAWDPAVVEPVGHVAGEWLTSQGGVAFSAKPGMVDAAVLRGQGMSGEGVLATVSFKVLSAGDPKIRILALDGRNAGNEKVTVGQTEQLSVPKVPTVTQLAFAQPNPFRGSATLAFSLAQREAVELAIYSVDGRRVRTLVSGAREPGEYRQVWDGRDDQSQQMGAGVYYARLVAGKSHFTRTVVYLK